MDRKVGGRCFSDVCMLISPRLLGSGPCDLKHRIVEISISLRDNYTSERSS